jgi:hypothetical protein
MSLMLSQLIWYAGNLADNIRLPSNSCWADFMINDDDNKDINAFVDDKLVVISVDALELTNIMGDNDTPFFADTK